MLGLLTSCTGGKSLVPFSKLDPREDDLIISGVISSVSQDKVDYEHPCQQHNCFATVVVTAINQRGKFFKSEFDANDTISVFFANTMRKNSIELFPEQKNNYPGLKKNEAFKAVAEQKLDKDGKKIYWIYGYEK